MPKFNGFKVFNNIKDLITKNIIDSIVKQSVLISSDLKNIEIDTNNILKNKIDRKEFETELNDKYDIIGANTGNIVVFGNRILEDSGNSFDNSIFNNINSVNVYATNINVENAVLFNVEAENLITNEINAVNIKSAFIESNTAIFLGVNSVNIISENINSDLINAENVISNEIYVVNSVIQNVSCDTLNCNAIGTYGINSNYVNTDSIYSNEIFSQNISSNNMISDDIEVNSINVVDVYSDDIFANNITSDVILSNAITSNNIVSNTTNINTIIAINIDTEVLTSVNSYSLYNEVDTVNSNDIITVNVVCDDLYSIDINTNTIVSNSIASNDIGAVNVNVFYIESDTINTIDLISNSIIVNNTISNVLYTDNVYCENVITTNLDVDVIDTISIYADDIYTTNVNAVYANVETVDCNVIISNNVISDYVITENLQYLGQSGVLKVVNNTIIGNSTTSDLPEGSNLYYTSERVLNAVGNALVNTNTVNLYRNTDNFKADVRLNNTDTIQLGSNSNGIYGNVVLTNSNTLNLLSNSSGVYGNVKIINTNSIEMLSNSSGVYSNLRYTNTDTITLAVNSSGVYANAKLVNTNNILLYSNSSGIYANLNTNVYIASSLSIAKQLSYPISLYVNGLAFASILYDAIGWVDYAIGKPVTISHGEIVYGGPTWRHYNSYWQFQTSTIPEGEYPYIIVDLLQTCSYINIISFSSYYRRTNEYMPKGYKIEYSNDGNNWTFVINVTNDYRLVEEFYKFSTAFSARYIKITLTDFRSSSWIKISGLCIVSTIFAAAKFGSEIFGMDTTSVRYGVGLPLEIKQRIIANHLLDLGGWVNYAYGKTCTISDGSFNEGWPPTFRYYNAYWRTTTLNSYITVDLGSSKTNIRLIGFSGHWKTDVRYYPVGYDIAYSTDGTNYTTVISVNNNNNPLVYHFVNDIIARYIRITITAFTSYNDCRLSGIIVASWVFGGGRCDEVFGNNIDEVYYLQTARLNMNNRQIFNSGTITIADGANIVCNTNAGTKIGASDTAKIAFYGATPIARQNNIPNPSGGSVVDAEARNAINQILTALRNIGIIKSS